MAPRGHSSCVSAKWQGCPGITNWNPLVRVDAVRAPDVAHTIPDLRSVVEEHTVLKFFAASSELAPSLPCAASKAANDPMPCKSGVVGVRWRVAKEAAVAARLPVGVQRRPVGVHVGHAAVVAEGGSALADHKVAPVGQALDHGRAAGAPLPPTARCKRHERPVLGGALVGRQGLVLGAREVGVERRHIARRAEEPVAVQALDAAASSDVVGRVEERRAILEGAVHRVLRLRHRDEGVEKLDRAGAAAAEEGLLDGGELERASAFADRAADMADALLLDDTL